MKILSVVGKKNTGKTSLTVKIIEELKSRGYNVASIKHSHHTMEMDKENTDTWKHKQAGSQVVVGVGSTVFFNIKRDMDLNRLLFLIKHLDNIDYVVIEGFKKYNYPKIATSPEVVDEYTIKKVNSFTITDDELKQLVDLIETRSHDIVDTLFANNCGYNNGEVISKDIRNGVLKTDDLDKIQSYLSIDGKVVGLNRFVSDYLKQSVLGILSTLNLKDYNVKDIKNIELLIPEGNIENKKGKCDIIINGEKLEINQFTNDIILNSIIAMVESLKVPKIKTAEIEISKITENLKKAQIELKVNNSKVELNEFSQGILKETIYAQINSLKINSEINNLKINVEK